MVLAVLPHTFLIFCSLSEHGPGGIDGLASWPQLCGPPLMAAFGPPDDPHGPLSPPANVPCSPLSPKSLCVSMEDRVCPYSQVVAGERSIGRNCSIGSREEFSQWWVLTLRFMGFPGDRGDNPPLRSRPSRAQCLCPL